jgi:phosphinothricin acetyltransferase
MTGLRLRSAGDRDLPAIAEIYGREVREGTASFELEPPSLEELARRLGRVRELRLPWLVAETDQGIAGYAYATLYRERPAYRHTVEDSVYLAPWARGMGIGRPLLEAVIAGSRAAGCHSMVAVIGDSANLGSVRLHRACGFVEVGILREVGLKFGRRLDTVLMQRPL